MERAPWTTDPLALVSALDQEGTIEQVIARRLSPRLVDGRVEVAVRTEHFATVLAAARPDPVAGAWQVDVWVTSARAGGGGAAFFDAVARAGEPALRLTLAAPPAAAWEGGPAGNVLSALADALADIQRQATFAEVIAAVPGTWIDSANLQPWSRTVSGQTRGLRWTIQLGGPATRHRVVLHLDLPHLPAGVALHYPAEPGGRGDGPRTVADLLHAALDAWGTADPPPDRPGRAWTAEDAATPGPLLVRLACDADDLIRGRVARNSAAPAAALRILAADSDVFVRAAVAAHPALPSDAVITLLEGDPLPVRRALAGNPATPPNFLTYLARDPSPDVAQAAAATSARLATVPSSQP